MPTGTKFLVFNYPSSEDTDKYRKPSLFAFTKRVNGFLETHEIIDVQFSHKIAQASTSFSFAADARDFVSYVVRYKENDDATVRI
ncbi:hypothetical protein [Neptuniibacter sp.]|uniref:hypothetical protein n=1 Tax=Neptuniibacter sp. TaxID=1962643 RepID=UPI0026208AB6|nr:hypothetical protein [Neptuniibacter sp.]MCP4597034.1 hypothetical protein [Neptuniibacter sp.]